MAIIDDIREKIASGRFEFSQHAVDQSIVRHISVQELREAIAVGEVIEDYPTDKYGPSCLVFGFTLKLITLYEPDPRRWVDFKVRRPSDEQ
jgi:hypothetical protein